MTTVQHIQAIIGDNAREKGFWDAHEDLDPESAATYAKLALIHSEVSEALEELRIHGACVLAQDHTSNLDNPVTGKPKGFWSEIADVVIRCLGTAAWAGVDLGEVVERKMAYNATRDSMHGKLT